MNAAATADRRRAVMSVVLAAASGALFGVGLLISGMTQPAKVVGFLDVLGAWDPSLLLVMGAALTLHVIAWRVVMAMRAPRFGTAFRPYVATPENEALTRREVEEMNRQECRGQLVETHVARPSAARERRRADLERLLEDARAVAALDEAERVHDAYLRHAGCAG